MFCKKCGKELREAQQVCLNCGTIVDENYKKEVNQSIQAPKSKIVAGILGILLGMFGVHNFYLGYNGKAVVQLLITMLSCFLLSWISGIWGFIEGIMILVGNIDKDASGCKLTE